MAVCNVSSNFMSSYFYTAKSLQGDPKTGIMEAGSEHELARILRQEGYILVSATPEKKESKNKESLGFLDGLFKSVSLTDKLMFTRNLQVMISSGIPLPRALNVLSTQAKSKRFSKVLIEIQGEVVRGNNFSETLSKYPDIFSDIFRSMISVGEETGKMDEVLSVLTRQLEREHDIRSKVKGAMMYPAVITCAMLAIGVLMLIMVVPQLAQTFKELGVQLPPITRAVIALGLFLQQRWYLLPFIVLGVILFFRIVLKTKVGKKTMDTLTLKAPILGPIIKKTNAAVTARTLGSLISSGVPLVNALLIVAGTLGNSYFQNAIKEAAEKVKKGGKLSEALRPYGKIYPVLVIQMIEVGEETGQTSEILSKLADFFEGEVGDVTKSMSSIIEPVLMVVIGAAVGLFAVSMIQPMYGMLGSM